MTLSSPRSPIRIKCKTCLKCVQVHFKHILNIKPFPINVTTCVNNMFKICVNVVSILSNRFETYFELATGMRMEAMLKNCLKWKQLCINRF